MKTLNLNLDEDLFVRSRERASQLGKTLNRYLIDLLTESVSGEKDPFDETLVLADKLQLRSDGGPLTREETPQRLHQSTADALSVVESADGYTMTIYVPKFA